MPFRYRSLLV